MTLAILLLVSYLIGAFPTAVVAGRLTRGIDIRRHGSGNAGGTNVWRVLGWKAGLTVSLVDLGKGAVAAGLVPHLPLAPVPMDPTMLAFVCGIAAVIGHVFPVYVGFRGGKGVATGGGMLLVVAPLPMGLALAFFALILFTTGCVSLGSLLAAISVPVLVLVLNGRGITDYPILLVILTSALAVGMIFFHRANIGRLIRGTEKTFPKLQLWRLLVRRRG